MGKLRAKRRAAERRRNLDGSDSGSTSEIDAPASIISADSRSTSSISDTESNNTNKSDDDTLADLVQEVSLGDSAPQSKSKQKQKQKQKQKTDKANPSVPRSLPSPPSTPAPMAVARAAPLLICSLGNPGSTYANTMHSAGHTVLKKLSERLEFQSYQKSRPHGSGLVSKPATPSDSDWTLWQSTSLMNISGKGVKAAHNTWAQDKAAGEGKLVIVHDELEKPLGAVNLNIRQGASAKGHNGLKSIMSSIGNVPFVRIGIGIGRPVSREPKDVANYVMRKMTPVERAKIEGCVDEVIAKLKELESG